MQAPVLYHTPMTRGETTLWMNEELGALCDVQLVNMQTDEQKQPDFLKLNPMGKIPTLTHDGQVVTESAAICAYLADAFPEKGMAPAPGDPARGPYYRWMFFAPSCIEPAMLDIFSERDSANPSAAGYGNAEMVIAAAKTAVFDREFVLGDRFSAADVVLGSALNFAMMFNAFKREEPFASYVDRLTARPAYKAAQEKSAKWAEDLAASNS